MGDKMRQNNYIFRLGMPMINRIKKIAGWDKYNIGES
jgi:hypothetical protein